MFVVVVVVGGGGGEREGGRGREGGEERSAPRSGATQSPKPAQACLSATGVCKVRKEREGGRKGEG